MSRLHLLILWILASGAAYFFLTNKNDPNSSTSATKLETGSPVFASGLVETIDQLKIEKGEDSVTLKQIDDQWVVIEKANFPANFEAVTNALSAIREAKVAQGVNASADYYDRFNLDPTVEDLAERPDTITLMSEGEEDRQLFLGKSRQATGGAGTTAGRFVRLSDDDSGVYIIQQSFASIGATPENWIDKDFSPLEEGVITIETSAPQDEAFTPWAISRKTVMDDFVLANLSEQEETKTRVTGTLKNILARSSFLELLTEEEVKERSNEKGTRLVKATDSAGTTFLLTIVPEKQEEKTVDVESPAPAAPEPQINYIVSLEILNGPTKPEPLAEDANTQEIAVFEQRVANLADLSTSVNRMGARLQGRHFLLNQNTIGALISSRGEFIQAKKAPQKKTVVSTKPIQVPLPNSTPTPEPGMNMPNQGPPPSIARPKTDEATDAPKKRVRSIDRKAQAEAKKAARKAAKKAAAEAAKEQSTTTPLPESGPDPTAETTKDKAVGTMSEEEAPVEEIPAKETPAKEIPAKEIPAKEAPAEEAPAKEAPAKETPAKEAPAEEAPAKEAPAKEAPAKETPAEEAPAKETPAKETPAKETPAKEAPAKEAPAEETPAKEAPAKETPAEEAPAKEAPAKEAPAKETPAKEAPAEPTPPKEVEATEQPTETPKSE